MANYRFGKHPPQADYRTLQFKDYFMAKLAPPPAAYNVLPNVCKKLKTTDPTKLYPMDGNDTMGDCTIAGVAHAITTYSGLAGRKKIIGKSAIVKLYYHLTGGVESGLNEVNVLNFWRQNSVDGVEILSYAKIDPKNHTNVQQAIRLFGGVYLGLQVQGNCLQEFNAHQPWTPGPLTNDGHAVYAVAYDGTGVTVLTWGNTQQATWAWWDECVGEAYAILPPEAKDAKFAPGYDLAQLQADLADLAN
jgi:hypothetical protein